MGLLVLRPSISSLLQSVTSVITKCDGLLLQSATAFLLQSATGITKCDNFITKCERYYKVRRLLQSATIQCLPCLKNCLALQQIVSETYSTS